tara:strand:+ start:552 stop:1040 length:489 start_codon:yes stop_codon:yes gene_type:complete
MASSLLDTALGKLFIEVENDAIRQIQFLEEEEEIPALENEDHPLILETKHQIKAYFNLQLRDFNLKLNPKGSEFQSRVWDSLLTIPFGKTLSYSEIAKNLGDPNYVRAVGNANGKNPIALVIPCHRIIGSTGNLVGYAGGLWRKKWLLDFEGEQISGQGKLF